MTGKESRGTTYKVQTSTDGGRTWKLLPTEISGASTGAVVRRFTDGTELTEGTQVVVIPVRSFQPVIPHVRTKTVTTFVKAGSALSPEPVGAVA